MFFLFIVSTTMETHIYKVMKFNKASEVLRDYLNQTEIISLFEKCKRFHQFLFTMGRVFDDIIIDKDCKYINNINV